MTAKGMASKKPVLTPPYQPMEKKNNHQNTLVYVLLELHVS